MSELSGCVCRDQFHVYPTFCPKSAVTLQFTQLWGQVVEKMDGWMENLRKKMVWHITVEII